MSLKAKRRLQSALTQILCLALGAAVVFPVVYGFLGAFKKPAEFAAWPPGFLPDSFLNTENFRYVFQAAPMLRYLFNSLLVATLGSVLRLFFALLAAYALTFFESFYSSDDLTRVVGMDSGSRRRIDRCKVLIHVLASALLGHTFKLGASDSITLAAGKIHIVEDGIEIKPGSSAYYRSLTACENIVDDSCSEFLICRYSHAVIRLYDRIQMMPDLAHFLLLRFCASDVHVFIQLNRVTVDYLAVDSLGEIEGDQAFAYRCRTGYYINSIIHIFCTPVG